VVSDELVRYEVDGGIATLTLDSPANRNALSAALVTRLGALLSDVDGDRAVRAAVLTHTGGTFCAGADMREARDGGMRQGTVALLDLLRRVVALSKPVVARVDGHVRAGGVGLIGACDIVLAGPRSTFAFSEVRIGLAPAIISLTTVPRLAGRAAGRYFLTGETFDAAEAARIGLVTDAPAELEPALDGVLDALRRGSPQGLASSKRLVSAGLLAGIDAEGERLVALSAELFGSAEAREGMSAFLAKRPPSWLG
jgi:enoyl-CoA hydratase